MNRYYQAVKEFAVAMGQVTDATLLHLHGSDGQMTVSDGDMRYILMPVSLGGGEE